MRDVSHGADGSKAIAPQIMQPVSLVLVAKAEIGNLRGFALLRGWDRRRLLSSSVPTFTRDVGMVGEHGSEKPDRSVFARMEHVVVSHRSTIGAKFDEHTTGGIDPSPAVWKLFDLLPQGPRRLVCEPRHHGAPKAIQAVVDA